ncbi:MAG: FHA domain-containing protein [bacterium]
MKFGSLQVRTPDGVSKDIPIDLPSLVLGRADGNGIVIDDLSVSRRHARIVIESGRLMIEDLGSAAGTFVDGHRIDPGTSNLVDTSQSLRFGDVQALFVPPAVIPLSDGDAAPLVGPDGQPLEPIEDAPSAAIRIAVTSPLTPVEPGGAAFATAVIQNRGRVVDLVTLTVTGIPASWVTFSQTTLAIVPGTRENISIVIQPPLASESLAGEYDFGVVVNSGEHEREGVDFGKLVVQPFESTEMHMLPVRSRRDFTLTAKNNGNALVVYSLSGLDDEGNFLYDFESPSIELPPGREIRVPVRVRQRKRRWWGRPASQPFRIVATPASGADTTVEATGQLFVQPPLERWKMPLVLLLIIALAALAFWISWIYRDQIPTWVPWSTKSDATAVAAGDPEAAYAGVHMCEKTAEAREKELAKVKLPQAGTTGAPLFAQNNPTWAKDEYAKADDSEFGPDWCGTTIEQCGCAMTSVATIMAIFNILTMPDGSELTPRTVNEWFNSEARKTSRGWVSKGYIYGDVIWTAANELSGQIAKQRPGSPTVRFAGFGVGSEEEIRAELQAGRPMVLEVPGHYIAAIGLDGDKILINDPYYADRKTLDVYKGKVKSSVKFEPSNDLSAVAITVPKDLRVRVLDKSGKIVGSLNTDESTSPAPVGITGAYLSSRDAWRDPTCVESPPPAGAGTTTIFLPGNREDYRIEVLNPSAGGTTVAIHSYDQAGDGAVETRDSTGPSVVGMSFDPTKAGVELQVIQGTAPGSTTVAGGTPTLPSGGNFDGGGATGPSTNPTTPPAAGVTPTPTPTKTAVPTPTPVAPAGVAVKCDVVYTPAPVSAGVNCTGTITGTATTTRWSINGLPAPVPPGSTAFSTTFTQDTSAIIEMTACNITVCKSGSAPVVIKFVAATPTPSATPVPGTPTPVPTVVAIGPPPAVNVTCISFPFGSGTEIDCQTSFVEAYNTITWNTTGPAAPVSQSSGSKSFTTFGPDTGTISIQATVCYNSNCTVSNLAIVQIGQIVTQINSGLCGSLLNDPYSPYTINAVILNWDSSKPIPTGAVTWIVNGNIVASGPVQPTSGLPTAEGSFTFGEPFASGVPLTLQYSGDSNWTSASASCTFESGGGP